MNLSAPSWDLFITLFLIISVGYGFLMQRERIVVTIVSAYLALVVSQMFWPSVFGFFHGDNPLLGRYFVRADLSEAQVQIGLFVISMILISTKAGIDAQKGKGWLSPFELLVLSGLAGAVIATTIIGYLPEESRTHLAEQSRFVFYLVHYHNLLLIAPIAAMVALGFHKGARE